jgi:hypothetical protein
MSAKVLPSKSTLPLDGVRTPASKRSNVDFPQRFGPMSAEKDPLSMRKEAL